VGQGTGKYIAGRFIFQGNTKQLNLLALAEEAAKIYVSHNYNVERYYLYTRNNRDPGKIYNFNIILVFFWQRLKIVSQLAKFLE